MRELLSKLLLIPFLDLLFPYFVKFVAKQPFLGHQLRLHTKPIRGLEGLLLQILLELDVLRRRVVYPVELKVA